MRGDDGRLLRSWRNGEAKLQAYLDDYAFCAEALIALFEVDLRNDRRLGDSSEFVALEPGSLFLGRRHQVVVR